MCSRRPRIPKRIGAIVTACLMALMKSFVRRRQAAFVVPHWVTSAEIATVLREIQEFGYECRLHGSRILLRNKLYPTADVITFTTDAENENELVGNAFYCLFRYTLGLSCLCPFRCFGISSRVAIVEQGTESYEAASRE